VVHTNIDFHEIRYEGHVTGDYAPLVLYYIPVCFIIYFSRLISQWSEFLATDPEARVRFPALPDKKVVGLERGPLSLVSITEEILDRKVAAPI
jgi:hypothetical protein